MTDTKPRVSIGMPVYNGERYLAEAIESALAQTFEDLELIVVDNHSTDGTWQILESFAARDPRVRIVRNPRNMGAGFSYRKTFALSQGEYFKWLAADDVMAPELIDRSVSALDGAPDAVMAYPRILTIDEDGKPIGGKLEHPVPLESQVDPVRRFKLFREETDYRHGARAWPLCYVFSLIRSSALRKTQVKGSYINADSNLIVELLLAGRFVEVPDYLMFFRHHPGSYSYYAKTDKIRQDFFDPLRKRSLASVLGHRRVYLEYVLAIARSRLTLRQKLQLYAYNLTWRKRRESLQTTAPLNVPVASAN